MITGDLDRALATTISSAGTWRPARRRIAAPDSPAQATVASVVTEGVAYAITYALARLPARGPAGWMPVSPPRITSGTPPMLFGTRTRMPRPPGARPLTSAWTWGMRHCSSRGCSPTPCEQALLYELSWFPERAAGAARRRRPGVFACFLEALAGTYFDCQEACPAVPPAIGPPGERASGPARLWLAAAARAGLGLLGADAPDRL